MAEQTLMAIDAGTGSVRAVLFDTRGRQLGVAQREWEHPEDSRYPGSMCFDWENGWSLAATCVREVLRDTGTAPEDVAAVSTTCMREGIVLYDAEGRELWACANVDARSDDEVAQLLRMNPALEKELYHISGQTYALGALPRLLWVKNKEPALYARIAKVSMFNDWLVLRLTGVLATEPSNGCTTGIFDLRRRAWAPDIARQCGLRDDIFPPVAECGTLVAHVSARGARETGLAEGTPVVAGGGDAQLGCVGVGVTAPGQAAVFGGSFWQYECNTDAVQTDADCRVRVNCHAVPGMWQYEAIAFKPGLAMRWFRDAFCQAEKELAAQQGRDVYDIMNEHAAQVPPGCHGMMCAFSDVMNYIGWRHAAPTFTNFDLNPEKFSKYTFYRAIMENAALVTRGHLELVRQATGHAPAQVVFAGGASKGRLWCQILADVLGIPVRVPKVREATALGTAILAGYGVGIYPDISEAARNLVAWDETFAPIPEHHATYSAMVEPWREMYQAQLELSNKGVTRHMWAAPGL